MRRATTFLIGAGTSFFLDPRQGRRRRHIFRDRVSKTVRQVRRLATRKAKRVGGHGLGLWATIRHTRRKVALDDVTVKQRIKSDALRRAGVSTREIDVEVDSGVVVLEGTVPNDTLAHDLVDSVSDVPGVRDVAAMLRVERSRAA